MSDYSLPITPGSGANIDTQNVGGNLRQTITIGDPTATTGVAPVNATYGLGVTILATSTATLSIGNIVNAAQSGSWNVSASITNPVVALASIQGQVPVTASISGVPGVNASIQGIPNVLATVTPLAIYNTVVQSLPSLAAGATSRLQLDQAANLLANVATVTNPIPVTQSGSWALNASVVGTVPITGTATIGNTVNALATVNQGTSPWIVSGTVTTVGSSAATVAIGSPIATGTNLIGQVTGSVQASQVGAWAVNASLVGQSAVTASVIGQLPVTASIIGTPTVNQGTSPWVVSGTVTTVGTSAATVAIGSPIATGTNLIGQVTGSVSASQVGAWVVNASLVGQPVVTASVVGTIPVSGTFWQANQPVSASVIGQIPVVATYAAPWNVVASQGGTPWVISGTVTAIGGSAAATVAIGSPIAMGTNLIGQVTGSVQVSQASSPWTVSGTVSPLGRFNTITPSLPSLAAGAPNELQLDQKSNLLVNIATVSSPLTALASVIGQLPVTATYSSPWNVVVSQGATPWLVNSSIVGTPWVNATVQTPIPVVATYAGIWTVNQGTNPWLTNASVVGQLQVTATQAAPYNVIATVSSANLSPTAIGGWNSYTASAVASAVSITASAGKLGGYMLINHGTTTAFVQIFDTSGNVTLGLTTPTMIVPIPANPTAGYGLAANLELTNGAKISNGIKMGVTSALGVASVVATGVTGTIWYV